MKKQILLFALLAAWTLTGETRMYAQSNPSNEMPRVNTRLFDLFSKGDAFGLWQPHKDSAQYITPNADLPGKLRMSDELNRLEEALACFDSLPLLNNMLYYYNHND